MNFGACNNCNAGGGVSACAGTWSSTSTTCDGLGMCQWNQNDGCSCPPGGGGGPNNSPKGHHDGSTCNISNGWSCDADNYAETVNVKIFVDGIHVATVPANEPPNSPLDRTGIEAECGGQANKRWSWIMPESFKNGLPRNIRAQAINVGSSGSDRDLTNTPKSVTCVPALIPNCRNVSGPNMTSSYARTTPGISSNFSAEYLNFNGPVTYRGMSFVNNTSQCTLQGGSPFTSIGGQGNVTFGWAAPTAGYYTAYCQAWNNNPDPDVECRGACVNGLPNRYQCPGTNGLGATTTLNICTLPKPATNVGATVALQPGCSTNSAPPGNGQAVLNFKYDPNDYSYLGSPVYLNFYINELTETPTLNCAAAVFPDICQEGLTPGSPGLTCDSNGNCSYRFSVIPGGRYSAVISQRSTCGWMEPSLASTVTFSVNQCQRPVTVKVGETSDSSCSASNIDSTGFSGTTVSTTVWGENLAGIKLYDPYPTGKGLNLLASPSSGAVNALGNFITNVQYYAGPTFTGGGYTTFANFCVDNLPTSSAYRYRLKCTSNSVSSGNCAYRVTEYPVATPNVNIGFERIPASGWYQTNYGDVYSGSAIDKSLPNSITDGSIDSDGIPNLVDGAINLPNSSNGLVVSANTINVRSFQGASRISSGSAGYQNLKLSNFGKVTIPASITYSPPTGATAIQGGACSSFLNNINPTNRVYSMDANCFNLAAQDGSGIKRYRFTGNPLGISVVYVQGSITLNNNLQNAIGSNQRLVLVVNGSITIGNQVGSGNQRQLVDEGAVDAILFAKEDLTVKQREGAELNNDLHIEFNGSVISNGNILLPRSRSASPTDPNIAPVEVFEYMPQDIVRLNLLEYSLNGSDSTGLYISDIKWEVK